MLKAKYADPDQTFTTGTSLNWINTFWKIRKYNTTSLIQPHILDTQQSFHSSGH